MGALIIIGVIVIISTIIYRISDEALFTSDNSSINTPTNIKLPNNVEVNNVNSNNETVTIYYTINDEDFIGIFSIKNGKMIKEFRIK